MLGFDGNQPPFEVQESFKWCFCLCDEYFPSTAGLGLGLGLGLGWFDRIFFLTPGHTATLVVVGLRES